MFSSQGPVQFYIMTYHLLSVRQISVCVWGGGGVLTIFALICWFPGTQKTNTGNPGSQVN